MHPVLAKPLPALGRPWWREPMLWLIVGGPAAVVVAALATAAIAWHGADRVLEEPPAAQRATDPALQPALKARNHAASPR
ncbi:hypothetical protein [uncultured Methylibium sp.]|uniref:hypothetical protein n=1 Tax=uncultured Methylibium sp. TaxID=381093 RepID=UPI0025D1E46B|nr:hypothetical protein [uncultured Methylibium sp.]